MVQLISKLNYKDQSGLLNIRLEGQQHYLSQCGEKVRVVHFLDGHLAEGCCGRGGEGGVYLPSPLTLTSFPTHTPYPSKTSYPTPSPPLSSPLPHHSSCSGTGHGHYLSPPFDRSTALSGDRGGGGGGEGGWGGGVDGDERGKGQGGEGVQDPGPSCSDQYAKQPYINGSLYIRRAE